MPPKGAPNILLIMTDDQGYGVSSTFGGVIPRRRWIASPRRDCATPSFHSTALCSPTRAALITGRNHHSVGFGVIGELSTGYPGYDSNASSDRRAPPSERFSGIMVMRPRGLARTTASCLSIQRRRAFRPMARRHGVPVFYGFLGGRPTSGRPTSVIVIRPRVAVDR